MSLEAYTLIITYFMAALGLYALSLVETMGPAFTALIAVLAAVSLPLNVKKRAAVPPMLRNLVAAAVFVLFVAEYAVFSAGLITAAARLLSLLLALKLFDLRTGRDFQICHALVFFLILAAAASTVSPVFVLLLAVFIISAIWAMIIFNIKKDYEENSPKPSPAPPLSFGLPFFFTIIALSSVSLVIAFVIFFTLPRLGIGLFESKTLGTVKVAGFSETVDLGALGPIKTDSTVVMRVEIKSGRPASRLYFRGAALDTYDGTGWRRTLKARRLLSDRGGGIVTAALAGPVIEQRIMLEPLDTEVLFAASHPGSIAGGVKNLWVDAAGSMYLPSAPYSRTTYTVRSVAGALYERPGDVDAAYTDASVLALDPEGAAMRTLAQEITAGKDGDAQRAGAIESYLKDGFKYTLDPEPGGGETPLNDFLFHSKEGYCEHYATAMVMLARAVGLPARIVNGFSEGEWNPLGNYFIVRQQDAHSWVEVYIEGAGWKTFDPTPPAGLAPLYRPSRLSLYLDMLRFKWHRYIIRFSSADQQRAAYSIQARTRTMAGRIRSRLRGPLRRTTAYALAVVAAAALLMALRMLKRDGPGRGRGGGRTPAYYIEMLDILKKKGLARRRGETPLELAERLKNAEVMEVTRAFHSERFGGLGPSQARLARIRSSLELLRRSEIAA